MLIRKWFLLTMGNCFTSLIEEDMDENMKKANRDLNFTRSKGKTKLGNTELDKLSNTRPELPSKI